MQPTVQAVGGVKESPAQTRRGERKKSQNLMGARSMVPTLRKLREEWGTHSCDAVSRKGRAALRLFLVLDRRPLGGGDFPFARLT